MTDSAAPDVRPTDDVDVIVGIAKFSDYSELQERLRKLGFKHDMDGPNCRFTLEGLKVDVMPSDGSVLGFTNVWYDYAMSSATEYVLPDGTGMRLIAAPAFIATKLEAFQDRGAGDFLMSHDLEDIIAVLDGRPDLVDEIKSVNSEVRAFIAKSFSDLLSKREFVDALSMHLLPDAASQARTTVITKRMQDVIGAT